MQPSSTRQLSGMLVHPSVMQDVNRLGLTVMIEVEENSILKSSKGLFHMHHDFF